MTKPHRNAATILVPPELCMDFCCLACFICFYIFTRYRSPFRSGPASASRLCKAGMLHRFRRVAKEANRLDLLSISSYREAKVAPAPPTHLCVMFTRLLQHRIDKHYLSFELFHLLHIKRQTNTSLLQ